MITASDTAAKAAGFDHVEVLFPYEASATETRTALIMNGLEMALMCGPPPNWTGGPRGFAAVPGLPPFPFLFLAAGCAAIAFRGGRRKTVGKHRMRPNSPKP